MWSAIIGSPISIEQVVMCMVALKLAREAGQHEDDNIDDAIGYLDLLKEVNIRSGTQEEEIRKMEEEVRKMAEANREEVERQKRQYGGLVGGARGPIFPGQS